MNYELPARQVIRIGAERFLFKPMLR